ncbi:MAG TPA: DUF4255 domain-containing protein [Usitatibacter sp.]|nr:DUF4255 domain-containing protein [Usitatibacter sp.]
MYQSLHAVSVTLQQFIDGEIKADSFLFAPAAPYRLRGMSVMLNTPKEMDDNNKEGVSLWLYRVVRDEQRLNDPPLRISSTQLRPAPLPLRLHYLVTPFTNRTNMGDPDTEQYLLGKIMQSLHTRSVLRGALLRGELVGSGAELHVRLETLGLEEIARVWDALDGSYQLAVSYEVAVVDIDSAQEPEGVTPVQELVADIGQVVAPA